MTGTVVGLVGFVLGMLLSNNAYDPIRTDFASYVWPTDETRAITSSFGEYRQTHFHAGIDISTRDRTGQPVIAARDGFIERILVSPTGYGKLLAVRHADGYSTVYAHLKRFNDQLERRVREEQRRLGCYPVDVNPPSGEIHVKQGELIAYSGDTGSGSAHLHFEIRDGSGRAVNPLLGGNLSIEDTLSPGIRGLAFVPIGPASFVNTRWDAATVLVRQTGRGRYIVRDKIRIRGDVGMAVDVRDRSNGSRFLHGVYSILLRIDGKETQLLRFDRVPMDGGHKIGLTYAGQISRNRHYQKLYVDSPYGLEMYAPDKPGSGIIHAEQLTEGSHAYALECRDYRGNVSTLEGSFVVLHGSPVAPSPNPGTVHIAPVLHLEFGDGFVRVVVKNVSPSASTRAELAEGGLTRAIPLEKISPGIQMGWFVPSADDAGTRQVKVLISRQAKEEVLSESWEILPLIPGQSRTFLLDGGNVRVDYGSHAVYSPLFVRYWRENEGRKNVYRFEPGGSVLDEGFNISLRRTAGSAKEGIFTRAGKSWSLLRTSQSDTGSWISSHIHRFLGDIEAKRDEEPPTVGKLRIDPGANRRPLISFRFQDNLAGIEYQKLKLYIDSVMTIPEIDGEHKRVFSVPDSSLRRGSHRLSIRLEDKMGNVALIGRTFNVR